MMRRISSWMVGGALVVMLAAPMDAEAQARGKGAQEKARAGQQAKPKPLPQAEVDRPMPLPRPELQRRNQQGRPAVPPGWCIGRGNPHNTVENCGPAAGQNFEQAHAAFHGQLDQYCRARAAERPRDIRWQAQVRQECRQLHDQWHARHDPNRRQR
jgi:hypothetical protein